MRKVILLGLIILSCLMGFYCHSSWNVGGTSPAETEEWSAQIKDTTGPEGHKSITLETPEGEDLISFSALKNWSYVPENPPEIPAGLKVLDGKRISIAGFMFPLSEGEKVKAFSLMASTQTCCYGPKPEFNQFILVESPVEVSFERLHPVKVTGTFVIDPKPMEGYIFRMTAEKVIPAGSQKTAVLADASRSSPFPWEELEKLVPTSPEGLAAVHIPATIQDLNQKEVVVGGYILGDFRRDGSLGFMVAHYPWDGCCTGVPPHIFNSTLVLLGSHSVELGIWIQQASFTGTLSINPPEKWRSDGLLNLKNARLVSQKG